VLYAVSMLAAQMPHFTILHAVVRISIHQHAHSQYKLHDSLFTTLYAVCTTTCMYTNRYARHTMLFTNCYVYTCMLYYYYCIHTNRWVGILAFGEGWHNNHHAFEFSARHGILKNQFDITWYMIRGLQKLGLATNVKLPSRAQLKRLTPEGTEPELAYSPA
jgi:hypothetical protein